MVSVKFERVTKIIGESRAVDGLTLEIKPGELFFLLGPSGCGKTTALRLVAGFYTPDEGKIFLNERDQSRIPPHKRNTGMVFQNYALWPHMNIWNNVAYGLKMRRLSEPEKKQRVGRALETVQMESYARRPPNQLSAASSRESPSLALWSSSPMSSCSMSLCPTWTPSSVSRCARRSKKFIEKSAAR